MSKQISTSHGTITGYSVEARCDNDLDDAKAFGDQVFGRQWRRIVFAEGPPGCGIPRSELVGAHLRDAGLYGYAAAQALRWWWHAEYGSRSICMETRLVRHVVKTDTIVTEHEAVDEAKTGWKATFPDCKVSLEDQPVIAQEAAQP